MPYIQSKIIDLLDDALTDKEVITFCYDHFEEIAEEVKSKDGKRDRVLEVIDYVGKDDDRIKKLLDNIKLINPNKYERHKPYFVAENKLPDSDEDEDPPKSIVNKYIFAGVSLFAVVGLIITVFLVFFTSYCSIGEIGFEEVDSDGDVINIRSLRIDITTFDDKNKGDRVDFKVINRKTDDVLGTKSSGTQQWDDDSKEDIVIELNPEVPLAECKNLKLEVKKVSVIDEQHNWEAKLKITAMRSDGGGLELSSPLLNEPKLKWNIYKSSKTFDLYCP